MLDELRTFVDDETPLEWVDGTASPLTGPAGNKEFLVLLVKKRSEKPSWPRPTSRQRSVQRAVKLAVAAGLTPMNDDTARLAKLKLPTRNPAELSRLPT